MMRSACLAMSLLLSVQAQADDPDARGGKVYPDGHGGTVYLPLGDVSFTDQAVSYTPGERGPSGVHAQADQAVGLPDYTSPSAPGFTSLGCHGSVVLQFTDNVLVDIEGADLYVFEVGPAVEATELAISYDGEHWIEVGARPTPATVREPAPRWPGPACLRAPAHSPGSCRSKDKASPGRPGTQTSTPARCLQASTPLRAPQSSPGPTRVPWATNRPARDRASFDGHSSASGPCPLRSASPPPPSAREPTPHATPATWAR